MKKRGAIELTTSTVVIVVIAVLMLILGTFFVKKAMCAAIGGVDVINDKVKNELIDYFTSQNTDVAIKEIENEIPKEINYNLAFSIRNEEKRDDTKFAYVVTVADLGNCKISEKEAENYIIMGKSGSVSIPTGETYEDLISFKIPKDAPLCNLKYEIQVKNGNELYGANRFIVEIKKASLLNSVLC